MRIDGSARRRRRGWVGLGLALSISLLGSACSRERVASAPANVLLIVVDTLRADRLGSYGASRPSSPHLDALAARSARFERAYATAPWTQPSVGSILTGLHPHRHRSEGRLHGIAGEVVTLAQTVRDRGWATGAVVSHDLVGKRFGFDRGFEFFSEDEAGDAKYLSTEGVTRRAISWLEKCAREARPFLLFVHYFDPHYPYLRHPEIGFAPASEGRLNGRQPMGELRRLLPELTREEIEFIRALYDEEVHYTDAGIGRLLAALDDLEVREETIVIVTGDHGEELGERGWIGHTRTLYDELLRVPLIVAIPGAAGGRVIDTPVSLVALAPTILELLGLRREPDRFDAPSFAPMLLGGGVGSAAATPVYAAVNFVPLRRDRVVKEAHKRALVSGRYKLVRDDRSGALELYDLVADPSERENLSEQRADLLEELLPALEAYAPAAPRRPSGPSPPLDPAEAERLRALGYVGDPEEAPADEY
jgi:arylsulfatase A-like enzyme